MIAFWWSAVFYQLAAKTNVGTDNIPWDIQPINCGEEETRYNRIRFCGESLGVKPRPSLSWHFWQYQSVRKCDGVFFYLLILYTAKWWLCFHFSLDTNFWQIAKEKAVQRLSHMGSQNKKEKLFLNNSLILIKLYLWIQFLFLSLVFDYSTYLLFLTE